MKAMVSVLYLGVALLVTGCSDDRGPTGTKASAPQPREVVTNYVPGSVDTRAVDSELKAEAPDGETVPYSKGIPAFSNPNQ